MSLEYEDSLKRYRDLRNVVDASREEGFIEGIEKGIEKTAKEMKKDGLSIDKIALYTGLSIEQINML